MTGRFNQDLPENLQTAFEKAINFEPRIITKQSINNRKVHEVNHIDITHGEGEVEINEAHVRNPNYKGKNYDPNYQQNRTKMNTNMITNTVQGPSTARNLVEVLFVVFVCIKLLGNVVRVYPSIVQGLMFLSA